MRSRFAPVERVELGQVCGSPVWISLIIETEKLINNNKYGIHEEYKWYSERESREYPHSRIRRG